MSQTKRVGLISHLMTDLICGSVGFLMLGGPRDPMDVLVVLTN